MAAVAAAVPLARAAIAVAVACTAAAAATSGAIGSGDSGSSSGSGLVQWAFPAALAALLLPPRRRPLPLRSQANEAGGDDSAAPPPRSASASASTHPRPVTVVPSGSGSDSAARRLSAASGSGSESTGRPWLPVASSSRPLVWLLLLLVCVDECGALLPRGAARWLQPLSSLNRVALAALTLTLAVRHWWRADDGDAPPPPPGPPPFELRRAPVPAGLSTAQKETAVTVSPLLARCCLPEAPQLIATTAPPHTAAMAESQSASLAPSLIPLSAPADQSQAAWLPDSQREEASTSGISSKVRAACAGDKS
jgi:hypothetical protein